MPTTNDDHLEPLRKVHDFNQKISRPPKAAAAVILRHPGSRR